MGKEAEDAQAMVAEVGGDTSVLLTAGAEESSVCVVEIGNCRDSSALGGALHAEETLSSWIKVACVAGSSWCESRPSDDSPVTVCGVLGVTVRSAASCCCAFFATWRYS